MNRYPITPSRIRAPREPLSPFLSDSLRDELRGRLQGPTEQELIGQRTAYRGQQLADEARGKYKDYDQMERAFAPRTQFTFANVPNSGDPAVAAQLRAQGYTAVEGMDGEGNAGTQWIAPGQEQAYQEYLANQQAMQTLGNEFNAERGRKKQQEYIQGQIDLRQANQMYGGLAEAGVSFAPGSLNDASVREQIWNSRGNLPGLVNRQSNDPEGFLRSPFSRSPFSTRWNPDTEYPIDEGMMDPRRATLPGATAGNNGVVEQRISYPQADMDRFVPFQAGDRLPDIDREAVRRQRDAARGVEEPWREDGTRDLGDLRPSPDRLDSGRRRLGPVGRFEPLSARIRRY